VIPVATPNVAHDFDIVDLALSLSPTESKET